MIEFWCLWILKTPFCHWFGCKSRHLRVLWRWMLAVMTVETGFIHSLEGNHKKKDLKIPHFNGLSARIDCEFSLWLLLRCIADACDGSISGSHKRGLSLDLVRFIQSTMTKYKVIEEIPLPPSLLNWLGKQKAHHETILFNLFSSLGSDTHKGALTNLQSTWLHYHHAMQYP